MNFDGKELKKYLIKHNTNVQETAWFYFNKNVIINFLNVGFIHFFPQRALIILCYFM